MQLNQLNEGLSSYDKSSRELEQRLRESKQHFEEKIAGSFCQQRRLADEKLRAVACKACAHTARDVVSEEEKRRSEEHAMQLRRRRAELRRTCAAYVRKERSRVEAIANVEAFAAGGGGSSSSKASAKVEVAWREAQDILQRALPLCRGDVSSKPTSPKGGSLEGNAATAESGQQDEAEEVPEDALAFFAREAQRGQTCIDCEIPDADWASVSCGAYLCVDCAGRHRGLGVHLSFVRSTTMDIWSKDQLRRMQLGGSTRLREFLRSYPKLLEEPQTSAALLARYNSRALHYYRGLLDMRCEGKAGQQMEAPPKRDEGHLPCQTSSSKDEEGDFKGSAGAEDEEAALGTVEEELAGLEIVYEKYRNLGNEQESPSTPPKGAVSQGGAPASPPPLCTGIPISPPSMESPVAAEAAAPGSTSGGYADLPSTTLPPEEISPDSPKQALESGALPSAAAHHEPESPAGI